MMIYILLEMHAYDPCPIMGVYTTPDLAKDQLSDADWTQNELGQWVGSRQISAWSDQEYRVEPWETDQPIDALYTPKPLYVPTPEEIAAEVTRAAQQNRHPRGVSSAALWGISASMFFSPYQASLGVAEAINQTQAKSDAEKSDDLDTSDDWKSRFDNLIKKVTEF